MTVNTERYLQVLRKIWTALGRQRGVVRVYQWFQQDGATPHTLNQSLAWLQQSFPHQLISRRRDPEWSPHSPDLNPQDFYLWENLKDNVYAHIPQTILDLKATITAAIRAIQREECVRVIENFGRWIQVYLHRRDLILSKLLESSEAKALGSRTG